VETLKWRQIFGDGSTDTIEGFGVWVAYISGRIKARERGTYLLNIEPLDEEAKRELERRLIVPWRK